MPSGLQVFKEDGSILLDTNFITYGLIKSGYLSQEASLWPWFQLRSAQLRPDREDSYQALYLNIVQSISVSNAISPIVFTNNVASFVGNKTEGGVSTFYFSNVYPETKAYVFDLMRDRGEKVGFQTFNENGVLTFTANQAPLNIVDVINAPTLDPRVTGGLYPTPTYIGGQEVTQGGLGPGGVYNRSQITVTSKAVGECATHITFSRGGELLGRSGQMASIEGVGGGSGVTFYFTNSPVSILNPFQTSNLPYWGSIPNDRQPQALVIQTSDYPFPFN